MRDTTDARRRRGSLRRPSPGRLAMILVAGVVGLGLVGMVVAVMLTHGSLHDVILHDGHPPSSSGAVPSSASSEVGRSTSYQQGYQSGAYGEAHDIRSTVGADDVACASTMGSPRPENEDDWDHGCLAGLRDHPAH